MAKPLIVAVDDEPAVLNAIKRDLQRHYGKDYRVLVSESGQQSLEALETLKLRNQPVALFLVDQRMPRMTGVEFLTEAKELYPQAKRALLTAYADTEAAIRAINEVQLDHYLMKPWAPPEDHLYPVLDDLLDEWRANYEPPYEGIRVIGHRWSPVGHSIKDFLARNLVPYQWLDVEVDGEGRQLMEAADKGPEALPIVVFSDGSVLSKPTSTEIAGKIGLRTHAEMPLYDLIIVGGGPSGLGAAVYGASEGLRTLLIEREAPGGQAGMSSRIENYLGFPMGVSGGELARRARDQARKFGAEILTPQEVCALQVQDLYRVVTLSDGTTVNSRALIIATGVSYRRLNVPGLDRLTGAGVYYGAAITEARQTQGQDAYIVGGANSAGQAAMYLCQFASQVTMLVRGESLSASMSQYLIDQIEATPNIRVRTFTQVVEVQGETDLDRIVVENTRTHERETMPAGALFIFIGAVPRTEWVAGIVARDPQGYILAGPDLIHDGKRPAGWPLKRDPYWLETSVPGIFVAGDVRHRSIKRVASAVGEGAMAVSFVHQYLAGL